MLFGQVEISSFFSGAVKMFFGQRWLSPTPQEKIGPYAYGQHICENLDTWHNAE